MSNLSTTCILTLALALALALAIPYNPLPAYICSQYYVCIALPTAFPQLTQLRLPFRFGPTRLHLESWRANGLFKLFCFQVYATLIKLDHPVYPRLNQPSHLIIKLERKLQGLGLVIRTVPDLRNPGCAVSDISTLSSLSVYLQRIPFKHLRPRISIRLHQSTPSVSPSDQLVITH
ncbi:hypothetical protein F5Y05DRAFT_253099 [Hypoxylon sp. FL0543]|nr:hypothetical protein F5Y05DRAFT_253099 [Hypoxylon sp. FL0543]